MHYVNILKRDNLIKVFVVLVCSIAVGVLVNYYYKEAMVYTAGAVIFLGLVLAIFKKPFYGLLLMTFFLPFERIGSFELGGMTVRISQVFALITLIVWLFTFFVSKKGMVARNPLVIPISLFLAMSVLSLFKAANLSRALTVLGFEFFVMLVALMIPNLVKTKEKFKIIIIMILISSFVVTLFGLFQFIGDMVGLPAELTGLREHYTSEVFGFPRIQGTASEPLYFANFLLIPIALCLALILQRAETGQINFRKRGEELKELKGNKGEGEKDKKGFASLLSNKLFVWIVLGLATLNLILTLSRGGFVGLAVILFFSVIIFWKSFFSLKRIVILGLVVLIAFFGTIYLLKFTRKDKNIDTFMKQATEYQEGAGIEERFNTYDEAWEMIKRNPILGVGVGGFGPEVAQGPLVAPKGGWLIVNNEYLEIWAETGIFGLLLFLLMIVIILMRSLKVLIYGKDIFLKVCVVGLMIAFLAILGQYMTFSTLYVMHFWVLIGLIVAGQNLCISNIHEFSTNNTNMNKI